MIKKALEELGAERVYSQTLLANKASQRVMQKSGMEFEENFIEDRFVGEDKRAVRYCAVRERGS